MANLFYSRKMPFYQFGDMFFLKKIPTDKWVPFIVSRFQKAGKPVLIGTSSQDAHKVYESITSSKIK